MQFGEWLREDIYQGFMNQRNRTGTLCWLITQDSGNQYTAKGERANACPRQPCGAKLLKALRYPSTFGNPRHAGMEYHIV